MSQTLNIVIPVVLIGYGVYLAVRMTLARRRGCSCGGCAGCPMTDGCRTLREKEKKEREQHER